VRWSVSTPSAKTTARSPSEVISSDSSAPSRPEVRLTPVAGDGHASRTNQHSAGSCGSGSGGESDRWREIEAHQPVAPVPVPMTTPEDEWRSRRPSDVPMT
jgi:hypothetical protein